MTDFRQRKQSDLCYSLSRLASWSLNIIEWGLSETSIGSLSTYPNQVLRTQVNKVRKLIGIPKEVQGGSRQEKHSHIKTQGMLRRSLQQGSLAYINPDCQD
jgi:hypothetical protein